MHISIRVDASPVMGGGHVMRCLTLADALAQRGARVQFVSALIPDGLAERIAASGHALSRIAPSFPAPAGGGWEAQPLPDHLQEQDAQARLAAAGGKADWILVDHYLLGEPWERSARAGATRILAIDDLANRRHDCDLLLDQTLGRPAADYRQLVPPHAELLTGSAYAPLRPEFAAQRPAALARRSASSAVDRLLISLGTMDLGGVTAKALAAVQGAGFQGMIDIVVGAQAASIAELTQLAAQDAHVQLHVDPPAMADLLAAADLAIGAAGTSSWERCCLGLPTLMLVLADNQRMIARQLEQAGAIVVAPAPPSQEEAAQGPLSRRLRELLDDPARLRAMSDAAAQVTDGRGAERVTQHIFEGEWADAAG